MNQAALKTGKSYAYVRDVSRFGDSLEGIHHHRPERAIVQGDDVPEGKVRVVLTSSDWNDSGVYASVDPTDLFMTWQAWKTREDKRRDAEAKAHQAWRESTVGDEAFAKQVAENFSAAQPKLVDGEWVFQLTALELHDLLRCADY